MSGRPPAAPVQTRRWQAGRWASARDDIAAEEPLQLSLNGQPLSVLMRTPGADVELAAGLLWAEGVITARDQLRGMRVSAESGEGPPGVTITAGILESNQVDVLVEAPERVPERSFLSSSACGVCGATTVESLARRWPRLAPGPAIATDTLLQLPRELAGEQRLFSATGGLHAAALFAASGELLAVREDVGRHNAVDKVVGWALLRRMLPASSHVLLVSGRAGYEVVQKAVAAGIPVVAAVGAPTTLAVRTATEFGATLVGFLRDARFNVYSAPERIFEVVK